MIGTIYSIPPVVYIPCIISFILLISTLFSRKMSERLHVSNSAWLCALLMISMLPLVNIVTSAMFLWFSLIKPNINLPTPRGWERDD